MAAENLALRHGSSGHHRTALGAAGWRWRQLAAGRNESGGSKSENVEMVSAVINKS